jgi:hypothetical protein
MKQSKLYDWQPGTANCGLRLADLSSRHMRSHEWIDERSLALDRQVAAKLRADPSLLGRARTTLDRWLAQRPSAVPPALREWQEILSRWPLERILELLASSDEDPRRLRQSSPFCGILSPEERLAILKEYESHRA